MLNEESDHVIPALLPSYSLIDGSGIVSSVTATRSTANSEFATGRIR